MINQLKVSGLVLAGLTFTPHVAWKKKYALGITFVRAESGTGGKDEDDLLGEEPTGGELSIATPMSGVVQKENNSEKIAFRNHSSTIPHVSLQVPSTDDKGSEAAVAARNPLKETTIDLDNASAANEENKVVVMPNLNTTKLLINEPTAMNSPSPTTDSTPILAGSTKLSLHTEENVTTSANNVAKMGASEDLNQVNHLLILIVLAGICCVSLFVWGRKKRSGATCSSSTHGDENSTGNGLKVQYTQVPSEQPFSHNQGDGDEFCDDYEEGTFANERNTWEDWENNCIQTQLNPFAVVPSGPHPTIVLQSDAAKFIQPQSPPHREQLQNSVHGGKDNVVLSSVESNSSNESFEVVTDEVLAPTICTAPDADKEHEGVDDLFSQFGMVPKFKKSAVFPTAINAPLVSEPTPAGTPPATKSLSSALFLAEVDDELVSVDAVDGWGEDDEWVKGI